MTHQKNEAGWFTLLENNNNLGKAETQSIGSDSTEESRKVLPKVHVNKIRGVFYKDWKFMHRTSLPKVQILQKGHLPVSIFFLHQK